MLYSKWETETETDISIFTGLKEVKSAFFTFRKSSNDSIWNPHNDYALMIEHIVLNKEEEWKSSIL